MPPSGDEGESPSDQKDEERSGDPLDPSTGENDGRPGDEHAESGTDLPGRRKEQQRTDQRPPQRGDRRGGRRDDREDSWQLFVRDVATSVLAVVLIGAYLFAISGVWPPMVAIESGSMEPHMDVNDLVFVMDEKRFHPSETTGDTGIVTARTGAETGYEKFENGGDVIVFEPNGNADRTPIIHRAMFWVEEGDNWVQQADTEYLGGASSCEEIRSCPADHDGFITKGDRNRRYDQAGPGPTNKPVKPEWIVGTAEVRVPGLGWLRLQFQ